MHIISRCVVIQYKIISIKYNDLLEIQHPVKGSYLTQNLYSITVTPVMLI